MGQASMKVCFAGAYPPELGAASQQTYWAARGLAERGHHVLVVTAAVSGVRASLDERDLPLYQPRFPVSGGYVQVMRAAGAELAQLAADAGCDVIVACAEGPYAAAGYLAARWSGRPLLLWPTEAECPPPATADGHLIAGKFSSFSQFVDGWEARLRAIAVPAARRGRGTGDLNAAAAVPDLLTETSIAAADRTCRGPGWLQFGLVLPSSAPTPALYAAVKDVADQALGTGRADEFFYMHKPPGMRLRFRPAGAESGELEHYLREGLSGWQRRGIITGWRPGVYEPEEHLFGGPVSMRSVHRVFTADSLAWLGYHRGTDERPGPAWAMSLLMIRALFDALRVVGWEDKDVWDRLQRQAGRSLNPAVEAGPGLNRLAALLRDAWSSPESLAGPLSGPSRELAAAYRDVVFGEGKRWFGDYFNAGTALVGPREVATFVIVFHWNRAGFPAARQALLTEALLAREPAEVR